MQKSSLVFYFLRTSIFSIFFVAIAVLITLNSVGNASGDIEDINTPSTELDSTNSAMALKPPTGGIGLVQTAFDTDTANKQSIIRYDYGNGVSIFKVRMRERIGTLIEIPETIESYMLGDSASFKFTPITKGNSPTNKGVLYSTIAGVDTNLNIIGASGKIYAFYLRVDTTHSKFVPHFVVQITDGLKTVNNSNKPFAINTLPPVKDTDLQEQTDFLISRPNLDLTKVNYNYDFKGGNTHLKPIRIFDDGIFTYFQFSKDGNMIKRQSLPTIYRSVNGKDMPVNMRIDGGFIIVERTSKKWTFRLGEDFACIGKVL